MVLKVALEARMPGAVGRGATTALKQRLDAITMAVLALHHTVNASTDQSGSKKFGCASEACWRFRGSRRLVQMPNGDGDGSECITAASPFTRSDAYHEGRCGTLHYKDALIFDHLHLSDHRHALFLHDGDLSCAFANHNSIKEF